MRDDGDVPDDGGVEVVDGELHGCERRRAWRLRRTSVVAGDRHRGVRVDDDVPDDGRAAVVGGEWHGGARSGQHTYGGAASWTSEASSIVNSPPMFLVLELTGGCAVV